MHEEGFKKALINVVNKYARAKNLLKEKDDNLLGEDVREGLTAVISVKLRDPQFEGQTKTKLGNPGMAGVVETIVNTGPGGVLQVRTREALAGIIKVLPGPAAPLGARTATHHTMP